MGCGKGGAGRQDVFSDVVSDITLRSFVPTGTLSDTISGEPVWLAGDMWGSCQDRIRSGGGAYLVVSQGLLGVAAAHIRKNIIFLYFFFVYAPNEYVRIMLGGITYF